MSRIEVDDVRMESAPLFEGPAFRLKRGGHTLYEVPMMVPSYQQVVPRSVDAVPEQVQRAYEPHHAAAIARYILDNSSSWAFGPITIAIPPDELHWEGQAGDDGHEFGHLMIGTGANDRVRLLDGQHRNGAVRIVQQKTIRSRTTRRRERARQSLTESTLSVTIYPIGDSPSDRATIADLFNNMAKSKPVHPNDKVRFDKQNKFHHVATKIANGKVGDLRWVGERVPPLMNADLSRPPRAIGKNTQYLLTTSQLSHMIKVRALPTGRSSRRIMEKQQVRELTSLAVNLFNQELPDLRPEWAGLRDIHPGAYPRMREGSMVIDPYLLVAAANSLARWRDMSLDIDPLKAWWREVDLSRSSMEANPLVHTRTNASGLTAIVHNDALKTARDIVDTVAEGSLEDQTDG